MEHHGASERRSSFLAVLAALLLAACASMAEGDHGAQDTSVITRVEIEEAGMTTATAYELVQRLRPRWLRSSPARSVGLSTVIAIYQDDRRMGGPDELRLIAAGDVIEIRYLDAAQAGRLPGIGPEHVQAAIVVTTRVRE